MPTGSSLVWDSQGLRKHSLQYSHSGGHQRAFFLSLLVLLSWGFFLPMLSSGSGLGNCPLVPGSFCEGNRKKRSRPILPNHTIQRSSMALFPIQDLPNPQPPPTPDRGIFSEAENQSHEQSSSTEVIKHGWFVVIDVVISPFTDPQTHKFRYTT